VSIHQLKLSIHLPCKVPTLRCGLRKVLRPPGLWGREKGFYYSGVILIKPCLKTKLLPSIVIPTPMQIGGMYPVLQYPLSHPDENREPECYYGLLSQYDHLNDGTGMTKRTERNLSGSTLDSGFRRNGCRDVGFDQY
jgi:hypothetical protein